MTPETKAILEQLVNELVETRRTVCVDGNASYQHGFFSGFELAQSVLVELARTNGVEVS
jgi:spore coat protein CotF